MKSLTTAMVQLRYPPPPRLRPGMRRFYIGTQRGGGIIGVLNRLVTRSRLGHALIAFDDGYYFSADGKIGWHWGRVADIDVPTRWQAYDVSDAQYKAMIAWCQEREGWPYGWIGCIRFTTLWRMFFASRESRRERRELFCSKGVHACVLEAAGVNVLGEAASWEVAPGHFRFSPILFRDIPLKYKGPLL
jgi:hypothetical protein